MLKNFNLHHPSWNRASDLTHHPEGDTLVKLIDSAGLTQMTRAGATTWRSRGLRNTIDLTFVTEKLEEKVIEYAPRKDWCFGSDHISIALALDMRPPYDIPALRYV